MQEEPKKKELIYQTFYKWHYLINLNYIQTMIRKMSCL